MSKKLIIPLIILLFLSIASILVFYKPYSPAEKLYVAIEGDGKVAILDPLKRRVIRTIDLSIEHDGGKLTYYPHNVQVAPDGKTVWITANAGKHTDHSFRFPNQVFGHGDETGTMQESDQIIVINPKLDIITKRIPIAKGVHLAHVVLTPDSLYAYATAQIESAIYKIDVKDGKIEKRIELEANSEPHGIRISPNGDFAYIAMLGGKSLAILDLKNDTFSQISLNGAAVQTGITPDGKFVFASIYDTKQLAVYSIQTKSVKYISLPQTAKGPIQMYATPDSRYVFLADQGYYFDQPSSDQVFKIDIAKEQVVKEIKAGTAPHGVVVSKDGKFVYVTNLLSGDVSIIDTATDQEVQRIKVGKEPNGISIWSENLGGTP